MNYQSIAPRFQSRLPCYRWLRGQCSFSNLTCTFSHTKDRMDLCTKWVSGNCIGGHGNSCRNRHYYLEEDRKTPGPPLQNLPGHASSPMEFSSPLVVRVQRVKEEHRRVEVDLETGKRTSFIEVTEKEIVDITGEKENTPVSNSKRRSERLNAVSWYIPNIPVEMVGSATHGGPLSSLSLNRLNTPESSQANLVIIPGKCQVCGRVFKGERGLRSHLSRPRSKCGKVDGSRAGEEVENNDPREQQSHVAVEKGIVQDKDASVIFID